MRRILIAIALLFMAAGICSAADAPKPNIILILADDLGYGDLGCFGQKRILTPNLDRMASEGMRLTSHYSGSTVCAPSRCVLMTGKHTGHCHVRGNGKTDLLPNEVIVPELLRRAGYSTAIVGKWGLGHEGSELVPTKKGFDAFFGFLDHGHAHNHFPSFLIRDEQRVLLKNKVPNESKSGAGAATEKIEYAGDLFAAEALAWIARNKEKPFFLFFAPTVPHANNEAGNKGMEVPDLGAYADKDWPAPQKGHAAMITRLDADVGRILAALKEHGIDDRTLILFTSDNGPHAEGGNIPKFNESSGPFRGIKRDLTDGGIRMPTIARWPGKIAPGTETKRLSYHGDVFATAAELVGVDAPAGLDSISFAPTLLGKGEQKEHKYLYWEFYEKGSAQAVRMGKWKAIRQPLFTGSIELYDTEADVHEDKNVAAENAAVVEQAKAAMAEAHVPHPAWKVPAKK